MRRVLGLAGPSESPVLAELVEQIGVAHDVLDPQRAPVAVLERGGFDVVLALSSTAVTSPPGAWAGAILRFVAGGGGLVCAAAPLHWFAQRPEWTTVLGAARTTPTGEDGEAEPSVCLDAGRHPVVANLDPDRASGAGPLAAARGGTARYVAPVHADVIGRCGTHPVVWTASHGGGRLVVDALAYDLSSLSHPINRSILQRAVRWVGES